MKIKVVKDLNVLEVTVSYGRDLIYRVRKLHVTVENLHLKMNEIFMSGQSTVDAMWKKTKDQIERSREINVFSVEIKHDGIWLIRMKKGDVQLKEIPKIHEEASTQIMRSLDQLKQGKPWDPNVIGVREKKK